MDATVLQFSWAVLIMLVRLTTRSYCAGACLKTSDLMKQFLGAGCQRALFSKIQPVVWRRNDRTRLEAAHCQPLFFQL